MLETLLESPVKEKVLLYLLANEDSYPSEIARNFAFNLNAVQYQLQKLEKGGVVRSRLRGKVRLYGLDPGYLFCRELESLLQKAFAALADAEKGKYSLQPRPRLSAALRLQPPELPAARPTARPAPAIKNRRPPRPVRRIPRNERTPRFFDRLTGCSLP